MILADGTEQITGYRVGLQVQRDGSVRVEEEIAYDFGGQSRHGIERKIPVTRSYDSKRNRQYPIDHITVSSPTGAPTDLETRTTDEVETLRIGDPGRTLSGQQTYVIDYDVRAAITSFADHQELYWNAIGNQWEVPIAGVTATVTGPAPIRAAKCFHGPEGSKETCPATIENDGKASFSTGSLAAEQGMTVVAGFPLGTFPDSTPILTDKPTLVSRFGHWLGRKFEITPVNAVSSLLLIGGAGLIGRRKVARYGRDQQFLDVTPGLVPGPGPVARIGPVPRGGPDPIAVRFTPPDGVRPGPFGVLINGSVRTVEVTATIVDLAVRGFLTIAEVDHPGKASAEDWRLVKAPNRPTDDLFDYEKDVLEVLFEKSDQVLLSDLKPTFRSALGSVRAALYAEIARVGWFQRDLAQSGGWRSCGGLLLFGGFVVLVFALGGSGSLVFPLALVITAVLMLRQGRKMRARTAVGTAFLIQAEGFRLYLEKAEASQIRFEERQQIFSRYLPFAVVLGVAEHWAGVFETLTAGRDSADDPGWYVGSGDTGFSYAAFGGAMTGFSAATDALGSSSGLDSGGSSGGGGGGGGGGSW